MLQPFKPKWAILAAFVLLARVDGRPDGITTRHKEGPVRGFLVLRTEDGKIAGAGEMVQTERPDRMVTRLTFHFRDGSLYDETTEFTQRGSFRLLSDHLVQKGPSFKLQIDAFLDASSGRFVARYQGKDDRQKELTEHLDVPTDVANGLVWTLVKNIDTETPETTVSMIAASPKPRLIKLRLIQQGRAVFSVAGSPHKTIHFIVPLFDGGPIWRIELASPVGPEEAKRSATP
jgi:hypothetical protein